MISDDEALEILSCTARSLKSHLLNGRIRFDSGRKGQRLCLSDVWHVKNEEAVKKAKKTAPTTRQEIITILDCLAGRRIEEYCIIDDWLVEYGLLHSHKRYRHGQKVLLTKPPTNLWYVYHLCRPDGRAFYVGKGIGNRMYAHAREAKSGAKSHKCNIIRKLWRSGQDIKYRIVFVTPVEHEAYRFETEEIHRIGPGHLSNISLGIGYGEQQKIPRSQFTLKQFTALLSRYKLNEDERRWAFHSWADARERELWVLREFARLAGYREALAYIDSEINGLILFQGHQVRMFSKYD